VNDNFRRLHAVLEQRDRDDALPVMYKIKVAHSVYSVRDEDRSESVRRQAIYRARFDRDATVGTLTDLLIILRFMYFTFCIRIF